MSSTRRKLGEAVTDQYRREQIGFPNQNRYYKEPRPARQIPTREQLEALALRQVQYDALQGADESSSGHSAGIHPEHRPFYSEELTHSSIGRINEATRSSVAFDAEGEYDLEEDESYYNTRLPTSSRRYHVSPEQIYQQGNKRYHVRYVDVPRRSSQQKRLPPQREAHIDEYERVPQKGSIQQERRYHPLVWFGLFLTLLILGWIGLNFVTAWYQDVQNDWTYGKERHFEINAIVGHNDSQTNPSHFTAENNNGSIYVIELPGGDSSKPILYQITTVPQNAGNPPVTVAFQDINRDGKLDMVVTIGNPGNTITIFLFNNGQKFVSKP